MIATRQEISAARAECDRIAKPAVFRHAQAIPHYGAWCYCSWCQNSAVLVPHYRRAECPDPGDYAKSP